MRTLAVLAIVALALHAGHGATLKITTSHTLRGEAKGANMVMLLTSDKEHLQVEFTAPYFANSNNSAHLFLADQNHKITELAITPSTRTLRMYFEPYNSFKVLVPGDSALFEASSEVSADEKTWSGTAKVHRDLLPPRIALYNAANVHPVNATSNELQYDNLYEITNYGIAIPDLMVLPRYKAIGPRFLFDNDGGYSNEWKINN